MRIDLVTIFPSWFDVLDLSLTGRARASGLLDVRVHDLRDWTHDRHRTVDDAPYGGGAGMVMKAEPWGEVLDALAATGSTGERTRPVLVVPTPSGRPFTQVVARELAGAEHLVFACGRYEGIDQRVVDEAATAYDVRELSLGDFVLNGGEAAAAAFVEAVVRLLPGFLGNPESLVEESHEGGLLEYPVYTKPASWRGHDVPEVLLSGDHGAIATWRREESLRRTARRRPDLLHPSRAGEDWPILRGVRADAGEILALQLACWVREAVANRDLDIPALNDDLATVERWLAEWETYVVRVAGRLVAAVRGRLDDEVWDIGRLMVAPDLRGRGLGRLLLEHIQAAAPTEATTYRLFTGKNSLDNLRMYKKAGFSVREVLTHGPSGPVVLTKRRR